LEDLQGRNHSGHRRILLQCILNKLGMIGELEVVATRSCGRGRGGRQAVPAH